MTKNIVYLPISHLMTYLMKQLFIVGFFILSISLWAQETSDSTQTIADRLAKYEILLRQNDEKSRQDSLARVDLMKRIQLLQESDKVAQATLRDQIKEIERRDSLRIQEQRQRIDDLKVENMGFPVVPFKDTLFTIYSKLGTMSADERADNISSKIELLVRLDEFFSDSLIVEEQGGTMDLIYSDVIITSISDWDALWADIGPKGLLANDRKKVIQDYVLENRNRSSAQNLMARIGLVFLILGGVFLVMYFLNQLATGVRGWMALNKNKYFKGIKIGNYEFLPPKRHLEVGIRSVIILKWALYVLAFYFSLPIIFGIFPFTKGWAQVLLDWILSPVRNILWGFWDYLPNFFTIAVIFVITFNLVRLLRFIATEIENGDLKLTGFHQDWVVPTFRLTKFLVYCFMIVVIYPYLPNSESEVFKGVSIFIGLLIALGSVSSVSNMVAGLVITYMRPYRIGDQVKIGDVIGVVKGKTLFVTRIRSSKNEDITVPNAKVLTNPTINYTSSSQQLGLVLHSTIKVNYGIPWNKVHELLIEAAVATDGINISREPYVLQKSLDENFVSYQVNAFTDVPERMETIYSDLHSNIQDKFKEAGIMINSQK